MKRLILDVGPESWHAPHEAVVGVRAGARVENQPPPPTPLSRLGSMGAARAASRAGQVADAGAWLGEGLEPIRFESRFGLFAKPELATGAAGTLAELLDGLGWSGEARVLWGRAASVGR